MQTPPEQAQSSVGAHAPSHESASMQLHVFVSSHWQTPESHRPGTAPPQSKGGTQPFSSTQSHPSGHSGSHEADTVSLSESASVSASASTSESTSVSTSASESAPQSSRSARPHPAIAKTRIIPVRIGRAYQRRTSARIAKPTARSATAVASALHPAAVASRRQIATAAGTSTIASGIRNRAAGRSVLLRTRRTANLSLVRSAYLV